MDPCRRIELDCDRLIQEVTALMFCGRCASCGLETEAGSGHHVIERNNKFLRHHPLNMLYLCNCKCHPRFDAHRNRESEFLIEFFSTHEKLKEHFRFWNRNRFRRGRDHMDPFMSCGLPADFPVREPELKQRREFLQQLAKGLKSGSLQQAH